MLKARLTSVAGPILLFGITRENVERLVGGDPILVDLQELQAGPGKILIMFGETQDDLTEQLHQLDPSFPASTPEPQPGQEFRYGSLAP